jgi:hypothetical protein
MACLCFTPHLNSVSLLKQQKLSMCNFPPEQSSAIKVINADRSHSIVAVHGLNGTARKTWTDKGSGKFWLEDFLPEALPKARIITFGYDSGLAFSKSTSGIENYARDLLNRLRIVRSSYEVCND